MGARWVMPCLVMMIGGVLSGCGKSSRGDSAFVDKLPLPWTMTVAMPELGRHGGRFVVGATNGPKTFNPMMSNETSSNDIISRSVHLAHRDRLYLPGGRAPAREILEVGPDGRTVTFHLRRGACFSDGHPITSADVMFWLRRRDGLDASPLDAGRPDDDRGRQDRALHVQRARLVHLRHRRAARRRADARAREQRAHRSPPVLEPAFRAGRCARPTARTRRPRASSPAVRSSSARTPRTRRTVLMHATRTGSASIHGAAGCLSRIGGVRGRARPVGRRASSSRPASSTASTT